MSDLEGYLQAAPLDSSSDASETAELPVVHAIVLALAGASLAPCTPEPPLAAPATPLSREQMNIVVGTGRRLLQQWTPLAVDRSAERPTSAPSATAHVKMEPQSSCLDSNASVTAVRAAAKDLQRTGRHIVFLLHLWYTLASAGCVYML